MEGYRTESLPSPEEQKKSVRRLFQNNNESNMKLGDSFYLISAKWWNDWKEYVYWDESTDAEDGAETVKSPRSVDTQDIPSAIDNEDLWEGNEMKPGLMEGENYVIVDEKCWNLLKSWYGGQPEIKRQVIAVGAHNTMQVEVYGLKLNLIPLGNVAIPKTMIISRATLLKDLVTKLAQMTANPPHRCYLTIDIAGEGDWKIVFGEGKEREGSGSTVDEVGMVEATYVFCSTDPHVNPSDLIKMEQSILNSELPNLEDDGDALDIFDDDDDEDETDEVLMARRFNHTRALSTTYHGIRARAAMSSASHSSGPRSSGAAVGRAAEKGLCGLSNLGNTCFMNSALQCLSNTVPLTKYFLEGLHTKDINRTNPLGNRGKLAEEYAKLILKMWSGFSSVSPAEFKWTVGRFAPQFSGYRQHDSQELLAFLLDGMHEDLNRIKDKNYVDIGKLKGTEAEVASKSWALHLERNQSVIVDLFQGQLKSTLVCPDPACGNVSVTFDPFMYLSLPLPSSAWRVVKISFVSLSTPSEMRVFAVRVDNTWDVDTMIDSFLSLVKKSYGTTISPSEIVLADVYRNSIHKIVNGAQPVSGIKQAGSVADNLFAFQICPSGVQRVYIEAIHQQADNLHTEPIETPFILGIPGGQITIDELYKQIASRVIRDYNPKTTPIKEILKLFTLVALGTDKNQSRAVYPDGQTKKQEIQPKSKWAIRWSSRKAFDNACKKSASAIDDSVKEEEEKAQMHTSLEDCLKLFLTQEKLGKNDEWLCLSCKKRHQATKKFDLWRLPKVLVIHLKRFKYTNQCRSKIDTFIDFPHKSLDLSEYLKHNNYGEKMGTLPVYDLFAVSCHSGGLGGGHYTAYCLNHLTQKWYTFNDSIVTNCDVSATRTSGAYLLFYQQREPQTAAPTNHNHNANTNTTAPLSQPVSHNNDDPYEEDVSDGEGSYESDDDSVDM